MSMKERGEVVGRPSPHPARAFAPTLGWRCLSIIHMDDDTCDLCTYTACSTLEKPMTVAIREAQHPGIWEVVYEGPVDVATRLLALDTGKGILESGMAKGVLVDFRRAELIASEDGAYELARERLSGFPLFGVKTAMLFEQIPEEVEFEVLVARNRGLCFEVFSDRGEAMAWLEQTSGCFV